MVSNNNDSQNGVSLNTEKNHGGQHRSEQPRNEQPRNEQQPRSRGNYQNQGQNRSQNQARQQNGAQNAEAQNPANKDRQDRQAQGQGHYQQSPKNSFHGARNRDANPRDANPRDAGQRGYYRDRARDGERDSLPRQHSGAPSARYGGNGRNRAEETIEDIKEDIIRLEKEIDLEIKEIRSLKL